MGKNKAVKDFLVAHDAAEEDLAAAQKKIETLESQRKGFEVLIKSLTKDRDHAVKQLEKLAKIT